MTNAETEVVMARRHVRDGEAHVARQRETVAKLREGGHPIAIAEALLATFEDALLTHKNHLARITGEQS